MALRLVTLESEPLPSAEPEAGGARAALSAALELQAQGVRALHGGQLPRFRELVEEAAAIDDRDCRYLAQSRLVSNGLGVLPALDARRLPATLAAIAEAALGTLEGNPCEPLLLNHAGVALYELWALDGAGALFEAALHLDQDHPNAARNLAAVKRRRKKLSGGRASAGVHSAAPALTSRALALAERAQPAAGLRLSLCMIVRDEEEMLPRCLGAAAAAVDEIVIVDTGSQDSTIEIARSFGAKVIEHPWTGSFADARNVSFDAASGDWLIYLDADEVLASECVDELRALTGRTWREAFYLCETSYTGHRDGGSAIAHDALRIFRNRPEYRFRGRLHEQIAYALPDFLPERFERTPVQVEHFGYLGDVVAAREKSKRNVELLRAQQADGADGPFLEFNLGVEMMNADEPHEAVGHFERAWMLLEQEQGAGYAFAPSLATRRADALRRCGRGEEAISFAASALGRFPGLTDLVLAQARAHAELGDDERAIECCERCIEMGDAPRRYTATVGSGSHLPRVLMGELLLARGDAERAADVLRACVREHPDFLGAVLPYADALLAAGQSPEAVVAELEATLGTLPASARFLLGTALYEAGATEAGARQFEAVLARQPGSGRARVALAEALLAQRRYDDAAQTACELPDDDALAPAARRSEIFARVLAGDGRAQEALARAGQAGLPHAERELFAMWLELAGGGSATSYLEPEAVPKLLVMLEALLRLQELKAFELLLPALERTPTPERERHHLLAALYLRRGFTASAAREWIAVCKEQPDARALTGLAQVADIEGMPDQAARFAREALACDPADENARRLAAVLAPEALTHAAAAANTNTEGDGR